MTILEDIASFIQADWSLAGELTSGSLRFNEGWYNPRESEYPQVTVSEVTTPELERFKGVTVSREMLQTFRPVYAVNCWHEIKAASDGTRELGNVGSMAREVARVFRDTFELNPRYGGSLTAFGFIYPENEGVPRHEIDRHPRMARYEVRIIATEHF